MRGVVEEEERKSARLADVGDDGVRVVHGVCEDGDKVQCREEKGERGERAKSLVAPLSGEPAPGLRGPDPVSPLSWPSLGR